MPTDDITIYYEASGELKRICSSMADFILETVKQPMVTPIPTDLQSPILTETAKVIHDTNCERLERRVCLS